MSSWLRNVWESIHTPPSQQGQRPATPSTKRDSHPPIVQRLDHNESHGPRKRHLDNDHGPEWKKVKTTHDASHNEPINESWNGEMVLPVRKRPLPLHPGSLERETKKVRLDSTENAALPGYGIAQDLEEECVKAVDLAPTFDDRHREEDQATIPSGAEPRVFDDEARRSTEPTLSPKPRGRIDSSKQICMPVEDIRLWAREPLRGIGRWKGSERIPGQRLTEFGEQDTARLPKPKIGQVRGNTAVALTGSQVRAHYTKKPVENVVLPLLIEARKEEKAKSKFLAECEQHVKPKVNSEGKKQMKLKGIWGRSVGVSMGPKSYTE